MEIRPILSTLMRNKTGPLLVAVQVAISLAILANALHIVNVRQAVAARPSGIADEHAVFNLTVRNMTNATEHNEQVALQKQQAALLRAVPGVLSVARVSMIPMSHSGSTTEISTGRTQNSTNALVGYYVSPDSLVHTWGLKLAEGREALPSEIPEIDTRVKRARPPTIVLTRAAAQKLWPGESSYVGRTVYYGRSDDSETARVSGIVERLQTQSAGITPSAEYAVVVAGDRKSVV